MFGVVSRDTKKEMGNVWFRKKNGSVTHCKTQLPWVRRGLADFLDSPCEMFGSCDPIWMMLTLAFFLSHHLTGPYLFSLFVFLI